MKDVTHDFGTDVLVVRACYHTDGSDLLAIAGEGSVQVIQCGLTAARPLAYFTVGLRVTSIAWSPKTVSPDASDQWFLQLAVSTHDFNLHLLTKSYNTQESVRRFGGGLTGHQMRVNDITFVGGQEDIARHIATVSDDRNLIVWDLHPPISKFVEPANDFITPQPQPTALAIPFAHSLCSVSSHPTTNKELLVSDIRGSVFLIDWRKDPDEDEDDDEALGHQNILELVHPKSLADAASNVSKHLSGYASWQIDDPNIVGAVFGSEYAVWDISKLKGGKPTTVGPTFPEGGHRFRWCPTYPLNFAISTSASTSNGAIINIYNIEQLQAPPTAITIAPSPQRVTDFDWIGSRGTPRLAVAVGREIYIFPISFD